MQNTLPHLIQSSIIRLLSTERAFASLSDIPISMITYRQPRLGPSQCNGMRRSVSSLLPVFQPLRRSLSRPGVSSCRAQKVSDLPANLKKIVGAFQMVPDPMARYKQLLFYATKLAPLPAEDHIPANKVEGCVSQVWVVPELRDDGKVYWRADSDSQLTKGLAALLVSGLSGCAPAEILSVQPSFIEMLGLKQSLTPSRNNGFLNMFRLMQRKTLELVAASAATTSSSSAEAAPAPSDTHSAPAASSTSPSPPMPTATASQASASTNPSDTTANGHASTNGSSAGVQTVHAAAGPSSVGSSGTGEESSSTPVEDGMRRKLVEALRPTMLVIQNDSAQHAGHAGAMAARHRRAGETRETHFRVEVVSEAFEGMTQVKRQRMIYQMLQDEFAMGLHALSLVTRTPAEAEKASTLA